jgi:hypothetical protein
MRPPIIVPTTILKPFFPSFALVLEPFLVAFTLVLKPFLAPFSPLFQFLAVIVIVRPGRCRAERDRQRGQQDQAKFDSHRFLLLDSPREVDIPNHLFGNPPGAIRMPSS